MTILADFILYRLPCWAVYYLEAKAIAVYVVLPLLEAARAPMAMVLR